jgi:hypothetical protein
MNDAARLALRLHAVIGIAALGCTRADPQNEQPKPEPTSTSTNATTSSTTTVATTAPTPTATPTPPPTGMSHTGGGCEPIAWCGTSAQAAANKKASTAMKGACPAELANDEGKRTLPGYGMGSYWSWANFDDAASSEKAKSGAKDSCCYQVGRLCGGGRPLLDEGRPIVASTKKGRAWSGETIGQAPIDRARDEREALGEKWLRDALFEQASVASFARASMELLAIGAPPELVEACHRAALDEVRHARLCFAMASRYLQREIDPGPMPMPSPRACSIVDVARNTFVEGCVGETISALDATRRAETESDPVAADVLRSLARDEESHAALAYETIACCIAMGGRAVASALRALMDTRDETTMDETSRDAWRDVIAPTMQALLSRA